MIRAINPGGGIPFFDDINCQSTKQCGSGVSIFMPNHQAISFTVWLTETVNTFTVHVVNALNDIVFSEIKSLVNEFNTDDGLTYLQLPCSLLEDQIDCGQYYYRITINNAPTLTPSYFYSEVFQVIETIQVVEPQLGFKINSCDGNAAGGTKIAWDLSEDDLYTTGVISTQSFAFNKLTGQWQVINLATEQIAVDKPGDGDVRLRRFLETVTGTYQVDFTLTYDPNDPCNTTQITADA